MDAAIADTFQKMMIKSSPELFDLAFNKIKRFVQSSIYEVAVSGSILGCMLKVTRSCVSKKNIVTKLMFFLLGCGQRKPHSDLEFFRASPDPEDPRRLDRPSG